MAPTYTANWFNGFSALTTLDLTNLDTSGTSDMTNMFSGCNQLSTVTLGEDFSFQGNNIASTDAQAILPSPPDNDGVHTGKWVNSTSSSTTKYTSAELRDAYDGSASMTGTYTWAEKTSYSVTFDSNGGSGTMAADTVIEGNSYNAPSCTFTPPSKKIFSHWTYGGQSYAPGEPVPVEGNITLVAQWMDSYTFTVQLDGGTYTSASTQWTCLPNASVSGYDPGLLTAQRTGTVAVSERLVLPSTSELTKSFYNLTGFVGTKTLPGGGTTPVSFSPGDTITDYTGDITVHAVWSETSYSVSFDNNGGSGTMTPDTVTKDERWYDVPDSTFTPPAGMEFEGWNTKADGSGNWHYYNRPHSMNQNPDTFIVSQDTILYAQWIPEGSANYAVYCSDGTLAFDHFDSYPQANSDYEKANGTTVQVVEAYPGNYYGMGWGKTCYEGNAQLPWFSKRTTTTAIEFNAETYPAGMCWWFRAFNNENLKTLDLANVNCANIDWEYDMMGAFQQMTYLETASLAGMENVENITNMSDLFWNCPNLKSVDFGSIDVSNALTAASMFGQCSSLETVNLSGSSFEDATSAENMFANCTSLETANLGDCFASSSLSTTENMFYNCPELKTVVMSGPTDATLTSMSAMFRGCSSLETLDLSGFNTSNVSDMSGMFQGCTALEELDLSSFDTSSVTSFSMRLTDCTELKKLALGEDFSFSGKQGSGASLTLPDVPTTSPYTGKWIRTSSTTSQTPGTSGVTSAPLRLLAMFGPQTAHADNATDGPFTSSQLAANYNGATMAGTWEWERVTSASDVEALIAEANAGIVDISDMDGKDIDPPAKWTTEAEKAALLAAIQTAQAAADDTSRDEFDSVIEALQSAIDTYEQAKKTGTASKANLEALIAEAQGGLVPVSTDGSDIDENKYWTDQAALTAMNSAISTAQAVADDPSTTTFGPATKALAQAMDAYEDAQHEGTVTVQSLQDLVDQAKELRTSNVSTDGSGVSTTDWWVTSAVQSDFDDAIAAAEAVLLDTENNSIHDAIQALQGAMDTYGQARSHGATPFTDTVVGNAATSLSSAYAAYHLFTADVDGNVATHVAVNPALADGADTAEKVLQDWLAANPYTDGEGQTHTYSDTTESAQKMAEFIAGGIDSSEYVDMDGKKCVDANSFAMKLARFVAASDIAPTEVDAGDHLSGPTGYWLIVTSEVAEGADTAGTSPIFALLGQSGITVSEKSSVPTISKYVKDDLASVTEGSAARYEQDANGSYYKFADDSGYISFDDYEAADPKPEIEETSGAPVVYAYVAAIAANDGFGKVADATIGQDLPFKLVGTLPGNLDSFNTYALTITDVLPANMLIKPAGNDALGSLSVSVGGTTATRGEDYTATFEGTTLTIAFSDVKTVSGASANATVVVTYEAHLNNGAVHGLTGEGAGNPNTATMTYPADPMQTGNNIETRQTSSSLVRTFTYKLRIEKTDYATGEALENTVFKVRRTDVSGTDNFVQADGTLGAEATAGAFMTDASGFALIPYLDAGVYSIQETQSTSSYQLLPTADTFTLVLSTVLDDTTYSVSSWTPTVSGLDAASLDSANTDLNSGQVAVKMTNDKQIVMPLTGGAGLAVIIVVGLVLVGASAWFIRRNRNDNEDEETES